MWAFKAFKVPSVPASESASSFGVLRTHHSLKLVQARELDLFSHRLALLYLWFYRKAILRRSGPAWSR